MAVATGQIIIDGPSTSRFAVTLPMLDRAGGSRRFRRMMSLENMIAALHFHVADRNCPEEAPRTFGRPSSA